MAQVKALKAQMSEMEEQLHAETDVHDEEARVSEDLLQEAEKNLEAETQRADSLEELVGPPDHCLVGAPEERVSKVLKLPRIRLTLSSSTPRVVCHAAGKEHSI